MSRQVKVALIGAAALCIAAAVPFILPLITGGKTEYTGRVIVGDDTSQPVSNAKVSVEVDQGVPQVLYSDSEGIFHVSLPPASKSVHVWVDAQGYEHYDRNVGVSRTGIEVIRLRGVSKPDPGVDHNQEVIDRKMEITNLRGDFETIPISGNAPRNKVNERAPNVGKEMLDIPDGSLDFSHRIVKYEYAAYAFMMAASTDKDATNRIMFADRSIASCNESERLLADAENSQDQSLLAAFHWASMDNTRPRVDYLLAIDYCIKAKEQKGAVSKNRVQQILAGIPEYFKEQAPPDRNPDLKDCLPTKRSSTK